MAISKVILNNDVQIDITDTTATQGQVASTAYYYGADGVKKQGSYVVPSAVTQATPTISVNTSTGLITASATQSAGVVSAGTKSATEQLSTENGKTVTPTTSEQTAVAANKYTLGAIKVAAMPAGSAATPATSITANPSISVSSSGLITASTSTTQSVTPTVSAGYVSSGTAGTITVSGSNTEQLTTQAAQTLYPSTTDQTISSGKYLTGTQTVKGVLLTNLSAGNIKKDVVVKVGDSADDDRITSVTGTYEGSGGGGVTPAEQKDVNFIDYDGSIVYSYTAAEFANLSALPANPVHDGLTAQGWNWSLSDAKTYVAANGKLWIGQMYVTSDGKTRIYIHLEEGRLSPYLGIAVNGTATVEWGDGSSNSTVTGTSTSTVINTQHNYSAAGDYVIAISVSGSMVFMGSNSVASSQVLWKNSTTGTLNRCYTQAIRKLEVGVDVSIGDYAFNYCYALSNITIPANVTSIGTYAFGNCYALSSITIPANVTSIGSNAFRYCYALSSITIPANVTSIGTYAFGNCYALSSITIPANVTSIGSNAFNYCYALSNITIPANVTSIGDYAFRYCYALSSITIPTNVTSIGDYAFESCPALSSITIPANVTSIGSNAFRYCSALSNITIPANVTSIGTYAFESCPALSSITIPANVTSIGSNAFRYCYALSNITIPANVTSIGTYAFGNCYGLGEIHFKPTTPPTVAASNAWTNIPIDCIICVPYSALADYLTGTNYPSPSTYTYFGYATYNSGVTLPTQDSTQAYNVVWYATEADAKAQANAILQGNGNEIYCICTAV